MSSTASGVARAPRSCARAAPASACPSSSPSWTCTTVGWPSPARRTRARGRGDLPRTMSVSSPAGARREPSVGPSGLQPPCSSPSPIGDTCPGWPTGQRLTDRPQFEADASYTSLAPHRRPDWVDARAGVTPGAGSTPGAQGSWPAAVATPVERPAPGTTTPGPIGLPGRHGRRPGRDWPAAGPRVGLGGHRAGGRAAGLAGDLRALGRQRAACPAARHSAAVTGASRAASGDPEIVRVVEDSAVTTPWTGQPRRRDHHGAGRPGRECLHGGRRLRRHLRPGRLGAHQPSRRLWCGQPLRAARGRTQLRRRGIGLDTLTDLAIVKSRARACLPRRSATPARSRSASSPSPSAARWARSPTR